MKMNINNRYNNDNSNNDSKHTQTNKYNIQ